MHCQMCLCKRSPNELAPVGSYIEPAEVRRFVVDAHHVDLVSAGGAGHAGNLILLCKLHHNNIGRKLSRVLVTRALRNDAKRSSVTFGEGTTVHGQRVKIAVPATREVIELFFTDEHANYWLLQDKAMTDSGVPGTPR